VGDKIQGAKTGLLERTERGMGCTYVLVVSEKNIVRNAPAVKAQTVL
jgi:hypothetical protein